jgi:hypothetical protein
MDDIRREIEQLTVTKKGPNKTNPAKAGSPGELYLLIFTYKYSFLKI